MKKKEFYDLETTSISGMSHRIPSLRGMIGRDSCLPNDARNSMVSSGNVFEDLFAREGPSFAYFENPRNLASLSCGL